MSGAAAIRWTQDEYRSARAADSSDGLLACLVVVLIVISSSHRHRDPGLGHQRDIAHRELGPAAALALEHRHDLLGEAAHLVLDLAAGEATQLEPRVEHEVVVAADRLDLHDLLDHLVD